MKRTEDTPLKCFTQTHPLAWHRHPGGWGWVGQGIRLLSGWGQHRNLKMGLLEILCAEQSFWSVGLSVGTQVRHRNRYQIPTNILRKSEGMGQSGTTKGNFSGNLTGSVSWINHKIMGIFSCEFSTYGTLRNGSQSITIHSKQPNVPTQATKANG